MSGREKENIYFTETQKFRQPWLWLLMFGAAIAFIYVIIQEMIKEPDYTPSLLIAFIAVIFFGVFYFLYNIKLETQIDDKGISYKFFPIQMSFKLYPWEIINKAYVRKYNPIAEYGGWGWRWGLFGKGQAFNVSGNMGLQLELHNGKKVLIGTNKPQEIRALLEKRNFSG